MALDARTWPPGASREVLEARAAMLSRARDWFAGQGVLEVQTPVLSRAMASDPNIESLHTMVAGHGRHYLQTSPEYPMKRLLAAGVGDCYQFCPVFRDGEAGSQHNPEFTMLEWYRLGFDSKRLQQDVDGLLRHCLGALRALAPLQRITYREAIRHETGLDCATASSAQCLAALREHNIPVDSARDWSAAELLDLVIGAVVGPTLGRAGPLFLCDYPASQAALARIRDDGDGWPVAERFELYLDGIELANGFHELANPVEQRQRFSHDLSTRQAASKPLGPMDERLLAALEHGLPDCAGVALGFDRLVMVALGLDDIDEAMAFSINRA